MRHVCAPTVCVEHAPRVFAQGVSQAGAPRVRAPSLCPSCYERVIGVWTPCARPCSAARAPRILPPQAECGRRVEACYKSSAAASRMRQQSHTTCPMSCCRCCIASTEANDLLREADAPAESGALKLCGNSRLPPCKKARRPNVSSAGRAWSRACLRLHARPLWALAPNAPCVLCASLPLRLTSALCYAACSRCALCSSLLALAPIALCVLCSRYVCAVQAPLPLGDCALPARRPHANVLAKCNADCSSNDSTTASQSRRTPDFLRHATAQRATKRGRRASGGKPWRLVRATVHHVVRMQ